jgi:hypothetical protein
MHKDDHYRISSNCVGCNCDWVRWWQLPPTSSSAVAVATPPPVQSEPSRPAIPKITYTERDIRELLDALSDADDLVSKFGLINPEYFLTQLGRKVTLQALNDSKDLLQKIVWPSINDFVYKEHNRYEAQMRIALALDQEAAKGELTRSLQSLIEKIELFPDDPDKIDVRAVGLVLPYYEKAKEHTQSFWNWLTLAQERTRAMQKNLREKGVTGFEAS